MPGDHPIHEFAVVRGHQKRARKRFDETVRATRSDSISKWLVGSSINRTSGRPSSTRAIATRIFQPPDNSPHITINAFVVETKAEKHLTRLAFERVTAEVIVLFWTSPKRSRIHPFCLLEQDRSSRVAELELMMEITDCGRFQQSLRPAPSDPTSLRRPVEKYPIGELLRNPYNCLRPPTLRR